MWIWENQKVTWLLIVIILIYLDIFSSRNIKEHLLHNDSPEKDLSGNIITACDLGLDVDIAHYCCQKHLKPQSVKKKKDRNVCVFWGFTLKTHKQTTA